MWRAVTELIFTCIGHAFVALSVTDETPPLTPSKQKIRMTIFPHFAPRKMDHQSALTQFSCFARGGTLPTRAATLFPKSTHLVQLIR